MKYDPETAEAIARQYGLRQPKAALARWEAEGVIPDKYFPPDPGFALDGVPIRALRLAYGKTQQEVAAAIGVARENYALWERNSKINVRWYYQTALREYYRTQAERYPNVPVPKPQPQ